MPNQDITNLITREATRLQAANHLVRARNELLSRMRIEGMVMEKAELVDRAGKIGDAFEKGRAARVTDGLAPGSGMSGKTLHGEGPPGLQGRGHSLSFFMGHFGKESELGPDEDETPDDEQMLDNLSTEGSIDSNEDRDLFEDLPEGVKLPAVEATLSEKGEKDGHKQAEKPKEEKHQGEQAVQDKVAEPKIRDFAKEAAYLQEVQKPAKGPETEKESEKVQFKAKGEEEVTEKSKGDVPSLGKQDGELPGSESSSGSSVSPGAIAPFQFKGVSGITTDNVKETEAAVQEESTSEEESSDEDQEFVIVAGEVESEEESSKDEGKMTEKKKQE